MEENEKMLGTQSYVCLKRDGTKSEQEGKVLKEHTLTLHVNGEMVLTSVCTRQFLEELVFGRLLTLGLIQNAEDVQECMFLEDYSEVHVVCSPQKEKMKEKKLVPIVYPDQWLFSMADRMAEGMPIHVATWATHSCFLYQNGELLFQCEDIGRHNAMDKVIGYALKNGISLCKCAVYSSGRVPVDMSQKIIAAGIPILVSKGIPTNETIELAKNNGLTLICSARRDQMKVYTDYRKKPLDVLILAGGKSRRMNGNHKGSLLLGKETFAEHLIKEAIKVSDDIWISCGSSVPDEYKNCNIVQDIYMDCGPIGGIHAGLKQAKQDVVMAVACDMPFMREAFIRFLFETMHEDVDAVVPIENGRIHPLAAIYKKSAESVLDEQIQMGNYRLRDALDKLKVQYVEIDTQSPMAEMLRNVNTEKEYQEIIECHLK